MNYSQLKNEIRDQIESVLADYWSSADLLRQQPKPGRRSRRLDERRARRRAGVVHGEVRYLYQANAPAGATTGPVSVVTPAGTLTGNPQFVVMK